MPNTTAQLTKAALFTALIAVLAQISIPFYPVPFTMQVFGVLLAGILLGSRAGLLSLLTYLILGAAGLPVFAMGRAGLQVILGPTGGYLLGFIPGVYCLGRLTGDRREKGTGQLITGMLLFLFFVYTCGSLQLSYIMSYNLVQTLMVGVIPFLPLDLAKIALTVPLANKLISLEKIRASS